MLIETAGGTKDQPTGRTALVTARLLARIGCPTTCSSFARFLRLDRTRVDPGFLFWWFQAQYAAGEMDKHQVQHTGVARFQFTRFLETTVISLPSKAEQLAIAGVLTALDDKIELNRRTNETLEAMARALFKSWFVDFDPVRAKAEGRAPVGMDAATAALFPSRLVETAEGEVPEGWTVEPLDRAATFLNGLALQKFPPTGSASLPVIKIAEMKNGVTPKSDRASVDIPPQYVVNDGDVLFSWSGSLAVVVWTGGRGALNQHLFKVTSDRFPRSFVVGWLRQHLPEFQEIAAGKATTMGHIQRHHLTDACVVIPHAGVLEIAHRVLEPLFERVVLNDLESRRLVLLRDSLLPRLLSGELRVGDDGAAEAA